MIKKNIILLLALLPFAMNAQQASVTWKVFTSFDNITDVVETPSMVYYLSAGSLYGYDKDNDENLTFSIDNYLTETQIKKIYYNQFNDYIAIAYESGNIDLLYADKKVVNLPEIRDAAINSTKVINDITFSKDDKMLVSTNFGLVLYDDNKYEVEQSGIYNQEVSCAAISDNYIFVFFTKQGTALYFIDREKRINNIDNFVKKSDMYNISKIVALSDNDFLTMTKASNGNNRLRYMNLDLKTLKHTFQEATPTYIERIAPSKNGYIAFGRTNAIECVDGKFNVSDIPATLKGNIFCAWDGIDKVWGANTEGVGYYDISSATPTTLKDKFRPDDALTISSVGLIYCAPSGKTYVAEKGLTNYYASDWTLSNIAKLNVLDINRKVSIVQPDNLTIYYPNINTKTTRSIFNIIEDINDPDCFYMSSYNGIAKIKNNQEIIAYNKDNSPLVPVIVSANPRETRVIGMDIDGNGNLWSMLHNVDNSSKGLLFMLPSDNRKNNTSKLEDWKSIKFEGYVGETDATLVACKKSNIVFCSYRNAFTILAYDNNNNKKAVIENVVDQDGKQISLNYKLMTLTEDNNGQIWIGTEDGVLVITNPNNATEPVVRVNRVKVPRNDGTNFADYLLEGQTVTCIAVDASNRKWIGTLNSGAYLVSADGSQILEHFTMANSALPNNNIYAIGCDKKSNAVYFGTVNGMVQYNSDSAPASSDYSDVYAYPNPVRPEYTGWITIRGLMDNSLVKIADSAGNVFYQGRSEGGMMTWDGCDKNGERVRTGVYYVFASQDGQTGNSGAVTKILVVR